tara:strand:+ start:169 stop:654 length:486 start_codon:yes stop_codon:yes gene_type:complete
MMTVRLDTNDFYVAKRLLKSVEKSTRGKVAKKALMAGGQVYLKKYLMPALLRRDHTLKSLAKMGHPYARRHGTIKVHQTEPWVVHSHTGKLARSVKAKMSGNRNPTLEIYSDSSVAPYNRFVFKGTKKMLGRNTFGESLRQGKEEMAHAIMNTVLDSIKIR